MTYYLSEVDALAETDPIPDISNHRNTTSPTTQNIYVRVDNNDVNACLGLGHHITLSVDPIPNKNIISAIIIPDKDIIPGAETLSPAFIIFNNYEKILNWNRSLRFALAVCKLKDSIKNEI